jgi:large subunit ribosomal protein L33
MPREYLFLECTECGERFYRTSKNVRKQAKLEIKKFCRKCRKHVVHKERKK